MKNSKSKGTWKAIFVGVLVLIVFALAGFIAWDKTDGFGKKKVENGGPSIEKPDDGNDVIPDKPNEPAEPEVAPVGLMTMQEKFSSGISVFSYEVPVAYYDMYNVSEDAESAKVLTASFTPADTTERAITWSLAWKNAESTWAAGKDVEDYVTLTVSEESKTTAVVENIQAFGEPIVVEVVSDVNAEIKASVEGNYVKALLGVTVGFGEDDTIPLYSNQSCELSVVPSWGVGTITPELKYGEAEQDVTLTVSAAFAEVYAQVYGTAYTFPVHQVNGADAPGLTTEAFGSYLLGVTSAPSYAVWEVKAAFILAAKRCATHAELTVDVESYYGDQLLTSKEYKNTAIKFDVTSMVVELAGITITGDDLIWIG